MLDFVFAALPSVIATATLGVVAFIAKSLKQLMAEHKTLMESERNDIKTSIVESYERAKERGYITHMELDTMNRRAESYGKLHGNSYVEAIVHDANTNLRIVGVPIPALIEAMDTMRKGEGHA